VSNTENTPSPLPSDQPSLIFLANGEDVAEYQSVEQQKRIIKLRLNQQTQALVALARSQRIDRGELKAALREITETAANVLEVERVSVWLYRGNSPSQTLPFWFFARVNEALFERSQPSSTNSIRMKCLNLYQRSPGCHTTGMELVAEDYPAYFQALAKACPLAVRNACSDPRTQELSETYLRPNGIASILNAPIRLNGQLVGMVCHEQVGTSRHWTLIEENFVAAIATLVALAIETCDRVVTQKQMRQHHQFLVSEYHDELERSVEERTVELTKANEQLQQEIDRRSMVEAQLRGYQHHLEELVEEGTREIVQTNEQLQQEILRHQQAQEALLESEEQFRCLSEATFEAILITERGNLYQVNSNFTELFGYEPSEVIGRNFAEFLAPEYRACVQQITALNSEPMYETRCLKKDGTTFLAEVRTKAIPYQGRLVNVTAIRDITVQSQAQEELKQSVSLLNTTLNSTTDGIVAVSTAGRIVTFNQKFVEMWGMTPEILMSPDLQERLRFFQAQLKEPEGFLERSNQLYAQPDAESYDVLELKDGRIIERFTQPQRSGTEIIGRVWCFRDITERAKAENALRQHLQQELLIAGMCDRIRQSLNLREILNTTVEEVRQFLGTDRVLIYRFEPDWSGTVVVESVAPEYLATLDMVIHDPCFGADQIEPYQQGRIQAIADIQRAELSPCYAEFLSQFQVIANLVVPILHGASSQGRAREGDWESGRVAAWESRHVGDIFNSNAGFSTNLHPLTLSLPQPLAETPSTALWGLLIAHHCSGSRQWQSLEIDLLKSLATQVAIAIQQSSLVEQLEIANQELQRLACVDGLTQVANRRRFDEYLNAEWRRLVREQRPLSLILCDIDYFKLYNDTYGHLAGDFCLQQVAGVLRQSLRRPADLVARYGGEEFAMILPNTDITRAAFIAEDVRKRVRGLKIPHAESPVSQYVTLSLGVATSIPTSDISAQELIAAADEALYQAKNEGRDRVVVN
jgi:diguanylate cyclase (GGDEF)-like protein/PAS domain S-box-containing protein